MWPTAWLSSGYADVLTFSMILMLIDIQVRAFDLSGNSVYQHVECHDLTSHQQQQQLFCRPVKGMGRWPGTSTTFRVGCCSCCREQRGGTQYYMCSTAGRAGYLPGQNDVRELHVSPPPVKSSVPKVDIFSHQ